MHASSFKSTFLIPLLLCSASAWATDIQCESAQQPGQRVICDHAILNHEYDGIYAGQQSLLQQGKLSAADLAAWKQKRDACTDVHCIDTVFAAWSNATKAVEQSAAAPAVSAPPPVGEIAPAPVMNASEALGPASSVSATPGTPQTTASTAAAAASEQSSSVPVSRQGSAYGVALPQAVSAASAPATASVASSADTPAAGGGSNPLAILLIVLVAIAALGIGAVVYQRRRVR
ncbi:hypothetical protein D0B32_12915 [Paraburkholderia sp. DHOC27]|nr:hypothetical protein D0B32_12915 [Paraburkholderia sp. DHOC27]